MRGRPRIISTRIESRETQKEVDLYKRRERVLTVLVNEIMLSHGVDIPSAKRMLSRELNGLGLGHKAEKSKTIFK